MSSVKVNNHHHRHQHHCHLSVEDWGLREWEVEPWSGSQVEEGHEDLKHGCTALRQTVGQREDEVIWF